MLHDEVGPWSEVKLEIVRAYASEYAKILSKQPGLEFIYIDAFASSGHHVSRTSGELIPGSPQNALNVVPPFDEYHFIDIDREKADALREMVGPRPDVFVHNADCNEALLERVLPRARYGDFKRALCFVDPYGLQVEWDVIKAMGHMRSVDMFLNFPVLDMKRNVLWRRQPELASRAQAERMTAFWGDESWREAAYQAEPNLFGDVEPTKVTDDRVAEAFRRRLLAIGGFKYAPRPIPMGEGRKVFYYLFFASHNAVAAKIANAIFTKYGRLGAD